LGNGGRSRGGGDDGTRTHDPLLAKEVRNALRPAYLRRHLRKHFAVFRAGHHDFATSRGLAAASYVLRSLSETRTTCGPIPARAVPREAIAKRLDSLHAPLCLSLIVEATEHRTIGLKLACQGNQTVLEGIEMRGGRVIRPRRDNGLLAAGGDPAPNAEVAHRTTRQNPRLGSPSAHRTGDMRW
jgi:hypothetical protein